MQDDDPTRVQLGPTGPVVVAQFWLDAVQRGDLRTAWLATHPDLRRSFADAWVNANWNHVALMGRDRSDLINELSAIQPDDPLWASFAATTLGECVATWEHLDRDTWGWGSRPRAEGPTRELVYLFKTSHANVVQEGDGYVIAGRADESVAVPAEGFVMEYIAARETEGVDLVVGDEPNLWRMIAFQRGAAAGE